MWLSTRLLYVRWCFKQSWHFVARLVSTLVETVIKLHVVHILEQVCSHWRLCEVLLRGFTANQKPLLLPPISDLFAIVQCLLFTRRPRIQSKPCHCAGINLAGNFNDLPIACSDKLLHTWRDIWWNHSCWHWQHWMQVIDYTFSLRVACSQVIFSSFILRWLATVTVQLNI